MVVTDTKSTNQQPSKEENTLQQADNESYELEDAHFTTATEETFDLCGTVDGISKLTSTPKLTKMQARQMGIDNSLNFNSTRHETPYSRAFKIQHSKTRRQRAPKTEYETPVIETVIEESTEDSGIGSSYPETMSHGPYSTVTDSIQSTYAEPRTDSEEVDKILQQGGRLVYKHLQPGLISVPAPFTDRQPREGEDEDGYLTPNANRPQETVQTWSQPMERQEQNPNHLIDMIRTGIMGQLGWTRNPIFPFQQTEQFPHSSIWHQQGPNPSYSYNISPHINYSPVNVNLAVESIERVQRSMELLDRTRGGGGT